MRLSAILLALVSLPALACPNLAGVYKTCSSSTQESTQPEAVTVTQQIVRNVTEYTVVTTGEKADLTTERYRTDGRTVTQSQTDPDSGFNIKTDTVATCQGSDLNVNMRVYMDSQTIGQIAIKIYKSGNKLVQEISGETFGENLKDTITCE
jgi:GTPase SAR1 family protein